jgi:tetratricopeptide (TPR) repeat protein
MDELPPSLALPVLRTYRLVLARAKGPEAAAALDHSAVGEWEEAALERGGGEDEALWARLALIAREFRQGDTERLALLCEVVIHEALATGARETALIFAEAAALLCPANAQYAYVAGRMHRERGQFREAKLWLRRSSLVAVWHRDWEAQATALNSLGNLERMTGRYARAEELLLAALRLAKRSRFRERLAKIYHDLLVVAVYSGDLGKGDRYARAALTAYGPGHAKLSSLAHDIAFLWSQHGYFEQALHVFQVLLQHFSEPGDRLRVLGYSARDAGALGDQETFERCWTEAWAILDDGAAEDLRADAALELGLGALNLTSWAEARRALDVAAETATAGATMRSC